MVFWETIAGKIYHRKKGRKDNSFIEPLSKPPMLGKGQSVWNGNRGGINEDAVGPLGIRTKWQGNAGSPRVRLKRTKSGVSLVERKNK